MCKEILQEINLINALPFYMDKDEFLDKLFSYLYLRLKIKKIKLLSVEELKLSDAQQEQLSEVIYVQIKGKKIKKLSKKNLSKIKTLYIDIRDNGNTKIISLEGVSKMFEAKELKQFVRYLKNYINKNLDFIQWIKMILQKKDLEQEKLYEEKIKTDDANAYNDQKEQYLQINPKKIPEALNLVKIVEGIETKFIKEMLRRVDGNKSNAAKHLGITERMIGYKIKKHNIVV